MKKRVLFLCTANSSRSQMAEGITNIGGTKKMHIGFDDPAKATGTQEEILNEFRHIRDEIKGKLSEFFIR